MDAQRQPWNDDQIVQFLLEHLPIFIEWTFDNPEGSAGNEDLTHAVIVAVLTMSRNGGLFDARSINDVLSIARTIARNMMISGWRHKAVVHRHAPNLAAREEKRDEREHDRGSGGALEANDFFTRINPHIEAAMPKDAVEATFIREYIYRLMHAADRAPSLRALSKEFWPDQDPTKGCRIWSSFVRRLMKVLGEHGIGGWF
jgi:hypothetical protein